MAQNVKRENYFELNLKDHDENFINNRSAQDLQRDAKKRIFKDMIYGSIDYEVYGKFFTDPNFVGILINTANIEAQKHTVTAEALRSYHLSTKDVIALALFSQHQNCAYVLQCIAYDLEMVRMNNYDIKYLLDLQIQIATAPNARKDYSEFY